ncbi:hypothetical protein FA048_14755 [Pedobacter polaris]|uniref:Uncharacterized protein n=1 Tax=Pedobacter polaris TaxID=2571273 RepID=A0A4U1CIV9_9SPHI|nr:hypothetical protein [Pedobacter polaris]TKC06474.1 hypothetical protein FA048_14755 [Pedobacter polaris]
MKFASKNKVGLSNLEVKGAKVNDEKIEKEVDMIRPIQGLPVILIYSVPQAYLKRSISVYEA